MPSPRLVVPVLAACAAVLGFRHVAADDRPRLGGSYLTAMSTDKPIYRPGETVWVSGVLLHAFTHTPMAEVTTATIEIKGPRGETVAAGVSATQDSVWAFGWRVPDGQAG